MTKKFCIVPWQELYSTSIGTFRMCCDEEDNSSTKSQQTVIDQGIEKHWNSDYMKNSRKIFLSGQLHPNCGRCWNDESNEKISLRMRRNRRYLGISDDKELDPVIEHYQSKTSSDGSISAEEIKGVHLSVGNTCQLRCTHCGPAYSNNVAKEYIKLGWSDSQNTRRSVFTDKYLGITKQKEYDATLWPQVTALAENLKYISFTGGEPLLSRGLYEFISWLDKNNLIENIDLHLTTNAVTVDKHWLELLTKFRHTQIRISIDGFDKLENYTRYPTNWNRKLENINLIKEKFSDVVLFTTIYALNLCDYHNFLINTRNWNIKRDLSLLSWPQEFDIRHLPEDLKRKISNRLIKEALNETDQYLVNGISSIINRLNMPRDPAQWDKAVATIKTYDTVRPNILSDLCPDLKDYY